VNQAPGDAALDALEQYVMTAPVLGTFEWPRRGSYPSYLLVLEGGVGVLAKPDDEHQDGPLITKREASAWVLARLIGWSDLVATTVLRPLSSNRNSSVVHASLQVVWSEAGTKNVSEFSDDDVWRAAVFDAVIRNADRSGEANWLAVPAYVASPMLKLPDHGYSLEPGLAPPSSLLFNEKQGQALPLECIDALVSLEAALNDQDPLQALLPNATAGILERVRALLRSRILQLP